MGPVVLKYEMVKNRGELGIDFEKIEGTGARVTKEFLRRLLKRILERSTCYYDEIRDHVFCYRERQLHSVICPSIADITSSFLMENPLTRKPAGEKEYTGSVDYWIYYKNHSFLMELKHTYFAYSHVDKPPKLIFRKFDRALNQLANVRKNECREQTYGKGLRKIALEVIVFYRDSKDKSKLKGDFKTSDFRTLFRNLLKNTELGHKSNFHALWILDKRLIEPFEYKDKNGRGFEIFPAIAFVGKISETLTRTVAQESKSAH